MTWNWQQPDWPHFSYDPVVLEPRERRFLLRSGEFIGALKHVPEDDRNALRIELIGDEALKTSEIEGEILDRASVQSSLREQFGLGTDRRRVSPAERGIAEMMIDLYRNFGDALGHDVIYAWHRMIMRGRRSGTVGAYRTHADPNALIIGQRHDSREPAVILSRE